MAGSADGAVDLDRGVFAGMLANRFGSGRVVLFGGLSYTLGVGLSALAYEPCLETVRHCGYLMLTGGCFVCGFQLAFITNHRLARPVTIPARRPACPGRQVPQ